MSEIVDEMINVYLWQKEGWPNFTWNDSNLSCVLAEAHRLQGILSDRMSLFGMEQRNKSLIDVMTDEILNSSNIEGERLDHDSVRSSLAKHLRIEVEGIPNNNHYIDGIVQVMIDATSNCNAPLSESRLFDWHAALFPTGRSGPFPITVANWRKGEEPMRVVSGALGKEKTHFEAPPSSLVAEMMHNFLEWIESEKNIDFFVKTAVAHLWFVTIHPFDDGNGRLCRTITEMLLSRGDKMQHRYYSLSSEIMMKRKQYYDILEATQKGDLDITSWISWFLQTIVNALNTSIAKTELLVQKVTFWDKHRNDSFNERQRKIINMLFDGFEGKLNSSKWAKINKCSQDTAGRDIQDLLQRHILQKSEEGGRSTNYELKI